MSGRRRETPENSVGTVIGGDALVEVTGPGAGEPVLVSHQWLTDSLETASVVQVAPCHPVTGALLDDDTANRPCSAATADADGNAVGETDGADTHAEAEAVVAPTSGGAESVDRDVVDAVAAAAGFGADSYRPSTRMAKRIRARDRRCRFPGCSIAAVFCDLDHVRPWPHGRTRDDNLLCLCRRHHRIKQRPGWQVTLAADAVATWTDPTGRTRTTHPVDALRTTILTGTGTGTGTGAGGGDGRPGDQQHQPSPHRHPRRPTQRARVPPRTPRRRPTGPPTDTNTSHRVARRPRPPPPHRPPPPGPAPSCIDHARRGRGWRARHPRQYRDTDLPPF